METTADQVKDLLISNNDVQAIVQSQQTFAISTSYQHVKGHQDKDTHWSDLSLLGQLNVEADKYAGDFRHQFGKYRPLIPLSPADQLLSISLAKLSTEASNRPYAKQCMVLIC